jgi:hypothetical protein
MKNSLSSIVLVLATVALAACDGKVLYGQADEPSIVFTQRLPATIPGDPTQTQFSAQQPIVTFTFDIPDVPLTGGSTTSNQSGFTIATMMRLNQSAFTIPPSFPNADFNGFDTVTLTIQSGSNSTTLATYTKDPAHLPGTTLVLQAVPNVEMLDYAAPGATGGKTITVGASFTGKLPANNWTADVDMDLHIKATAGWP